MKFYPFWQQLSPEGKREFAARAKTSVGYCHLIAGGHRKPGHKTARKMVEASDGELTLAELRDDIWDAA